MARKFVGSYLGIELDNKAFIASRLAIHTSGRILRPLDNGQTGGPVAARANDFACGAR
jgi:hypothetical protein